MARGCMLVSANKTRHKAKKEQFNKIKAPLLRIRTENKVTTQQLDLSGRSIQCNSRQSHFSAQEWTQCNTERLPGNNTV